MKLLDLPPEMFQRIVHVLVQQTEPQGAWKLRGVCRTFAAEIEYDIFAMQTQDAFASDPSRLFMRKHLWRYLFYRTKSILDADATVPDIINATISYLQGYGSEGSNQTSDQLREALCKAVGHTVSMQHLGFKLGDWSPYEMYETHTILPSWHLKLPGDSELMLPHCKLAMAAATGNMALSKDVLSGKPRVNPFEITIFGNAVTNSFEFDHPAIFDAIAAHVEELAQQSGRYLGSYTFRWEDNLKEAMRTASISWIRRIIEFVGKPFFMYSSGSFQTLLHRAIIRCNSQTAITFLDATNTTTTRLRLDAYVFKYACKHHSTDVVMRLLNISYHGANSLWRNSSPLTIAVNFGTADTVTAILDAGAVVDGIASRLYDEGSKYRTKVVPIEEAMKRGNRDIIQILLSRGAKVEGLEVANRKKAVYNLLRDAKMKETGKHVPTYSEKYSKVKQQDPAPVHRFQRSPAPTPARQGSDLNM
ncbi:hypothetical protein SLS60_006929 [Paraconiothyrium brasiliense]|uniref:Ankyrin repeat domain-containing protein n=1 Tax=Paraconiothyrium brasiliense TaxID=300254 RepID=A0ABR3R8E6_9PLEO